MLPGEIVEKITEEFKEVLASTGCLYHLDPDCEKKLEEKLKGLKEKFGVEYSEKEIMWLAFAYHLIEGAYGFDIYILRNMREKGYIDPNLEKRILEDIISTVREQRRFRPLTGISFDLDIAGYKDLAMKIDEETGVLLKSKDLKYMEKKLDELLKGGYYLDAFNIVGAIRDKIKEDIRFNRGKEIEKYLKVLRDSLDKILNAIEKEANEYKELYLRERLISIFGSSTSSVCRLVLHLRAWEDDGYISDNNIEAMKYALHIYRRIGRFCYKALTSAGHYLIGEEIEYKGTLAYERAREIAEKIGDKNLLDEIDRELKEYEKLRIY